jgi:hypothetical protein
MSVPNLILKYKQNLSIKSENSDSSNSLSRTIEIRTLTKLHTSTLRLNLTLTGIFQNM